MNKPLTDEQVQEIKEALDKATPGPWKIVGTYLAQSTQRIVGTDEDEDFVLICDVFLSIDAKKENYVEPDAHLISNAPEYIRLLLADREHLQVENEQYKKHAVDFEEMYKREHREKNSLTQQLQTAKESLEYSTEMLELIAYGSTDINEVRQTARETIKANNTSLSQLEGNEQKE